MTSPSLSAPSLGFALIPWYLGNNFQLIYQGTLLLLESCLYINQIQCTPSKISGFQNKIARKFVVCFSFISFYCLFFLQKHSLKVRVISSFKADSKGFLSCNAGEFITLISKDRHRYIIVHPAIRPFVHPSVCHLIRQLVGWLIGCSVAWSVSWSIDRSVCRPVHTSEQTSERKPIKTMILT